jgi:hypothetical protein
MRDEISTQRSFEPAVQKRGYECWYRVRSCGKVEIFVGHRIALSMEEIALLPEWVARALFAAIQGESQCDEFEQTSDRAFTSSTHNGSENHALT